MDRRQALILLNMYPAFGFKKYKEILEKFNSPEIVFKISMAELKAKGFSEGFIKTLTKLKAFSLELELAECDKKGIKILTYEDNDYPEILKEIFSPPLVLYVKGEYNSKEDMALAIVGSRRPTLYGRMTAEKLAKDLALMNVTVVSGLARGIDTAAHQGVLKGKGRTIAVLGSGLGKIYPPENQKIAGEICERGLIISEFPYRARPLPANFPRRNRLISGLSAGVIIVEAARRSGALITADLALEQGREVFAVPGKIDSPTSWGVHQLIKEGAKMVVGIEDILEEFKCQFPKEPNRNDGMDKKKLNISQSEEKVFSLIEKESESGTHIDEIIRHSRINAGEVTGLLLNLELKGLIKQLSGKRFIRMV